MLRKHGNTRIFWQQAELLGESILDVEEYQSPTDNTTRRRSSRRLKAKPKPPSTPKRTTPNKPMNDKSFEFLQRELAQVKNIAAKATAAAHRATEVAAALSLTKQTTDKSAKTPDTKKSRSRRTHKRYRSPCAQSSTESPSPSPVRRSSRRRRSERATPRSWMSMGMIQPQPPTMPAWGAPQQMMMSPQQMMMYPQQMMYNNMYNLRQ